MGENENPEKPTARGNETGVAKCVFAIHFIAGLLARAKKIVGQFYDEIWMPEGIARHSLPMRFFSRLWRIVEITISRTLNNKIPLQAAALTYYVLMALAPLVMFGLTIFGIVMNVRGEEAVETMKLRIAETMQLIAPEGAEEAAAVLEGGSPSGAESLAAAGTAGDIAAAGTQGAESVAVTVAPALQEFANNLLESTMSNSGSAGTIGFIVLAVLAIFMIARMEDAYNLIWNVKEGRGWGKRFLVYFLFLICGGALFAGTASMLSVSAVFKRVSDITGSVPAWATALPGGEAFFGFMTSFVPTLIAFLALMFAFACLNKYLPKTKVRWAPALAGGAFVAAVFLANQKLAMLYVKKISEFNSIYGNLGVIFILMFLLYMGWIFVLLGGQLSFAVQNARYLKNLNRDWAELSPRAKQEAFFACLFALFAQCSRHNEGLTLSELSVELSVPVTHVVECVDVLKSNGLVCELAESDDGETRYNSAGTVAKMTLGELKSRFDNLRSPLTLGGNAELQGAIARFSSLFSSQKDSTKMEDLLTQTPPAHNAA